MYMVRRGRKFLTDGGWTERLHEAMMWVDEHEAVDQWRAWKSMETHGRKVELIKVTIEVVR